MSLNDNFFSVGFRILLNTSSRHHLPVGLHVKPYSLRWTLLTCKGSRLANNNHWSIGVDLLSKYFLQDRRSKKDFGHSGKEGCGMVGGADITKGKQRLGRNYPLSSGTKGTCSKTKAGKAPGVGPVSPCPLEDVLFLASVSDTALWLIKLSLIGFGGLPTLSDVNNCVSLD